MGETVESG